MASDIIVTSRASSTSSVGRTALSTRGSKTSRLGARASAPVSNCRLATRQLFKSPCTMMTVISYSVAYLLAVFTDLILDEFQCACSIDTIRQDVANASRAECASKLAHGGPHCLSMIFIDEKNALSVRIDLGFLYLFLAEISLRIFGTGVEYLKSVLNAIDLVIVVSGMVLDHLVIISPEGTTSNLGLLRLIRLLRIMRVLRSFHTVQKQRQRINALHKRSMTTIITPPVCNWKEAKVNTASTRATTHFLGELSSILPARIGGDAGGAPALETSALPGLGALPNAALPELRRYACFLSHSKAESAADARYVHDLLQMLLGVDVFLDSSDLVDLRVRPLWLIELGPNDQTERLKAERSGRMTPPHDHSITRACDTRGGASSSSSGSLHRQPPWQLSSFLPPPPQPPPPQQLTPRACFESLWLMRSRSLRSSSIARSLFSSRPHLSSKAHGCSSRSGRRPNTVCPSSPSISPASTR